MNTRSYLLIFLFIMLTMSCSATGNVHVNYEYDHEIEFNNLRSFDWFPVPKSNVRYDLIIKQIKSELKIQLHEKGINLNTTKPDFLIAIHGGIQYRLDHDDWNYLNEKYEQYWIKRRMDIVKYHDDMLIIDIIDTTSKTLIYRATADAFVSIEPSYDKRRETINATIMKILENFPPIEPDRNVSGVSH